MPFKGATETLTALLGRQIDFTFDVGVAIPQIKAGKLRLLAVVSAAGSSVFPNTPAMGEAGVELNGSTTHGFYPPAGISRDVVNRLNREIVRIMQTARIARGAGLAGRRSDHRQRGGVCRSPAA